MNASTSFENNYEKPPSYSNFASPLPVNDEIQASQNTPFSNMKKMISTLCGSGECMFLLLFFFLSYYQAYQF
jgi:hypothetical protein